jgi:uncharacterized damage-inducible protein DinB
LTLAQWERYRATMLAAHYCLMARNNAWSNHRLHAACARLSDGEYRAERTSFFPSIHLTLNHILIVDWYYLDALEGSGRGWALSADPTPFAAFTALRAAQVDADRRLVAYTEALTPERLAGPVTLEREGGVRHLETTAAVLAHLFVHQIHHRGQVHAMLAGTAVEPPQLDEFFLAEDAPRRAAELAALGFTSPVC